MTSRKPSQRALWLAVIVLIIMTTVSLVRGYTTERDKKEDAQADKKTEQVKAADAASEGKLLADEVLQVCRAGGKEAKALSAAGLCGKASTAKDNIDETVKDNPADATSTTTIVRRETVPLSTLTAIISTTVNRALTASCGADGCRDGDDGADSQVPGPVSTVPGPASTVPGPRGQQGDKGDQGDPPSEDTLVALIRRVLAENPPTNGTDGRGIASLVCSSSFGPITFTLTLTDGTTQEFSCGSTPLDPDPDPTAPAE